jgi:DNA repair protein RadC
MPETRLIPIYNLRLERRGSIRYADRDISSPAAASTLAREIIAEELTTYAAEQFVTLYLNTKNRPVGYSVTSIGTLNATLVHPREVLKGALLTNAHAFIVAHNHPSGDPVPSQEDREVTDRLKEAGALMGIALLDHLVIGHDGRYTSFRERGRI